MHVYDVFIYCLQDPIRSFSGREKYKRPLWAITALENPSVVSLNYD